ncbi:MAG: DNA-protecting protein DprA [Deltaproteobacteria bacterium]|nr:DNA-protecting protein DprA [Deltaproteobacteria bacterium]
MLFNSNKLGYRPIIKRNPPDLSEFDIAGIGCIPSELAYKLLNGYAKEYPYLFYKGDVDLLSKSIVSVVGTRNPSMKGIEKTTRVAATLVSEGYIVMSGLAKGIDTVAHETTLRQNGKTIAVLGTPLTKIYPAKNKKLADNISKTGLLLSPSLPDETFGKHLFPRRNKLMARLSIATIIIEAGETSGVIHQAAECQRQGKIIIFLKSLVDKVTWANSFIKNGAHVIDTPKDLKELLK